MYRILCSGLVMFSTSWVIWCFASSRLIELLCFCGALEFEWALISIVCSAGAVNLALTSIF